MKAYARESLAAPHDTAMDLFASGLGVHPTWTRPFGRQIVFAIFNRFDGKGLP